METIYIHIAKDFSEYPGVRSIKSSDFSAEQFYDDILQPKFLGAIGSNKTLTINLDGGAGYASSFLDEAFGRLSFTFGSGICKDRVVIISTEEPELVEEVFNSIDEWAINGVHPNSPLKKYFDYGRISSRG